MANSRSDPYRQPLLTPISDVSSRQIYQIFLQRKEIPPTAKQKLQDKYSDTIVDLENVLPLAFNVTLESKLREFQVIDQKRVRVFHQGFQTPRNG